MGIIGNLGRNDIKRITGKGWIFRTQFATGMAFDVLALGHWLCDEYLGRFPVTALVECLRRRAGLTPCPQPELAIGAGKSGDRKESTRRVEGAIGKPSLWHFERLRF
jgi:hypothetical protein